MSEEHVLYIDRANAHLLSVADMPDETELRPTEDLVSHTGETKQPYYITKYGDLIEVCVPVKVSPLLWKHRFVSGELWFRSYEKALESEKTCITAYSDVYPDQVYSMLYYFNLKSSEFDTVKDILDKADTTISSVIDNAISITKRELLKYFNE